MKKLYLTEMETEKRNELIKKKNNKLITQLQNDLYASQMDQQSDAFDCIINKEGEKAIQYHDSYNSFFYTLKDWRKFITNIDADYLTEEGRKTYDEIQKTIEELDNMNPYSDEFYNLDAELEEKTKDVLQDIETYLHEYEQYPDEDDAIQYADEMEQLNDYYIEEHDDGTTDGVIRLDVSYTETFI